MDEDVNRTLTCLPQPIIVNSFEHQLCGKKVIKQKKKLKSEYSSNGGERIIEGRNAFIY